MDENHRYSHCQTVSMEVKSRSFSYHPKNVENCSLKKLGTDKSQKSGRKVTFHKGNNDVHRTQSKLGEFHLFMLLCVPVLRRKAVTPFSCCRSIRLQPFLPLESNFPGKKKKSLTMVHFYFKNAWFSMIVRKCSYPRFYYKKRACAKKYFERF